MLVYLSGGMTGLPEHNYPAFVEAAARLRELGFDVLNPAETAGGITHLDREIYMAIDTAYVQSAEAVVVLPSWRESQGAKLEMILASSHGKPIYEYDEETGIGAELRLLDWIVDAQYVVKPPRIGWGRKGKTSKTRPTGVVTSYG